MRNSISRDTRATTIQKRYMLLESLTQNFDYTILVPNLDSLGDAPGNSRWYFRTNKNIHKATYQSRWSSVVQGS